MARRGSLGWWNGAGALLLGLLATSCTAILGIDKDYRESGSGTEPSTGAGGGSGDGAASSGSGSGMCGGVTACEDVPSGWTTVRAMQVADASLPPGMCADGKTMPKAYYMHPAGPPTCAPCVCDVAPTAQCSAPPLSCWFYSNICNNNPGLPFTQQANTNKCIDLHNLPGFPNTSNGGGSCKLTGSAVPDNSSACTASGGAMMDTPTWGGAVFVCESPPAPADCMGGQLCVPTDAAPDGPVCIEKDGNDPCPAGWPTNLSAFANGVDNRSCSACSCSIGCTGGNYVVHDTSNCTDVNSDPPVSVNTTNCTATPNLFDNDQASLAPTVATPTIAACSGGQPQGQVSGTGPTQICCK